MRLEEDLLALESPNVKSYIKELDLIQSKEKRRKLENILRTSAYKNISGETSSTGKYHPSFSQGEFGLSRHTKAVVKLVMVICDAFPELDQDTLVIAAIAHDAFKYKSDNDQYTSKYHALDAAEILQQNGLHEEARLVSKHMGRWDVARDKSGRTKNPEKFDEKMLHLADYIASKKFIHINFDKNNDILEEQLVKEFIRIYENRNK